MTRSTGVCITMGTASTMAWIMEAWACACPATRPSPRSMPVADAGAPDRPPDRAMVHEDAAHLAHRDRSRARERDPRQRGDRRLDQRRHPPARPRRRVRRAAVTGGLRPPRARMPLLVEPDAVGKYLMEDFAYAGGIPAVLSLASGCRGDALTVGRPYVARDRRRRMLHPRGHPGRSNKPIHPRASGYCAGISPRRRGHQAVGGAPHCAPTPVAPSCSSSSRTTRRGSTPDLAVDPDSILVLKGCGPNGYPGMPEVGKWPCRRSSWRGRHGHGAHLRLPG